MVDQIAVVKIDTPSVTGNFPITSPDITEPFKAAILIFTTSRTEDTNNAHCVLGLGFIGVDGTSGTNTDQVAIAIQAENGVGLNQDMNTNRNLGLSIEASNGVNPTVNLIAANYVSATTGGVILNFTTVTNRSTITAILFAGIDKAAAGNCTFDDSGISDKDVGVSPFWQPDLVIFRSSDNTLSTDTANGTMALGFATRLPSIQQVSSYINLNELSDPTDADGFYRSDCCSSAFIGDRTIAQDRFRVTSFDSTGFNAIAEDTGGLNSPQANYLALKFTGDVQVSCKNLSVAASTGNQTFNDFGFFPDLVFGMSHLMTTVNTLIDGASASAAGYFVTGELGSRAYCIQNETPLNINTLTIPTNAHTRQGDHAVMLTNSAGTLAQEASWSGDSGGGGFILNFSTASLAGTLTAIAFKLPGPDFPSADETEEIVEQARVFHGRTASETIELSESVAGVLTLAIFGGTAEDSASADPPAADSALAGPQDTDDGNALVANP